MDPIHIIILALVQGLSEFLPISSSAHLILMPILTGWQDQGIVYDVAAHVGTLTAVCWYFRRDIRLILLDWSQSLLTRQQTVNSRLGWAVLWGTIPTGLAGLLFHDFIAEQLRSPLVIASTTILFGLLLWYADVAARRERDEYTLTWKDVLVVGCAQALALIPGTSRSGITITAGLMMGLQRTAAARFSFLLSIPLIILAGGFEARKLLTTQIDAEWSGILLMVGLSAVSAYLCIRLFLKLLETMGMLPFVIYRLCLGVVLFALFL